MLEQKGAVTAVLTTEGFEDVLEIGRLRRTRMYDVFMDAETPTMLAPKRRAARRPASASPPTEAWSSRSTRTRPRAVIRELVEHEGVEAFAVSLLFSFRNPAHEQRLRELIQEIDPGARGLAVVARSTRCSASTSAPS